MNKINVKAALYAMKELLKWALAHVATIAFRLYMLVLAVRLGAQISQAALDAELVDRDGEVWIFLFVSIAFCVATIAIANLLSEKYEEFKNQYQEVRES